MERNQNGYPIEGRSPGAEDYAREGGCCANDHACMDGLPLAYAYVPIQKWRMLYSTDNALGRGTMFEELDKPMEVYGNEW